MKNFDNLRREALIMGISLIFYVVIFGVFCLFNSCVAYKHLEVYPPTPDKYIIKKLTVHYRVKPTSKEVHIPFFLYGVKDIGPYFFQVETSMYSDTQTVNAPSITIKRIQFTKNEEKIELLDKPIFLNVSLNEEWNKIYSKRRGKYKFSSTYTVHRALPVDFETDKGFDVLVELALNLGDREIDYMHTIHYKKHLFRGKQWYWRTMMHV